MSFLTDAKPMADLLESLNPPQKEAVLTTEGPVLVLAGAGSGKTRVLTFRIAHLVSSGLAQPHGVLAMTFTNKAAGEMKERVKKLLGVSVPWVTTFHSFCARMLRDEAPALGYPSGFSIYDEEDSQAVIKKILNSVGRDSKEAGRVLANIS
ncbi:MAG: UvrD-helicase domain-containing protein, partial [candidate division Zixibacteria bacterium]|nr:UvrD-helicase domain-containing protein [candidate division Zixibacteria bacterium]